MSMPLFLVKSGLESEPEKINQDAYSAWLFKLKPSNPAELDALLDAAAYAELLENEDH